MAGWPDQHARPASVRGRLKLQRPRRRPAQELGVLRREPAGAMPATSIMCVATNNGYTVCGAGHNTVSNRATVPPTRWRPPMLRTAAAAAAAAGGGGSRSHRLGRCATSRCSSATDGLRGWRLRQRPNARARIAEVEAAIVAIDGSLSAVAAAGDSGGCVTPSVEACVVSAAAGGAAAWHFGEA